MSLVSEREQILYLPTKANSLHVTRVGIVANAALDPPKCMTSLTALTVLRVDFTSSRDEGSWPKSPSKFPEPPTLRYLHLTGVFCRYDNPTGVCDLSPLTGDATCQN